MSRSEAVATHADYTAFVESKTDDQSAVTLMVDGVHCAACIQKIESTLHQLPYVTAARLNFSTKRLAVEWQGGPARANDLAQAVEEQGYKVHPFDVKALQAESDEEERFLQLCLGVAAFASGNIMMLSVGIWAASLQEMGAGTRDMLHWVSALIAIPAVAYSGRPFFSSAWSVLKHGKTNMDVPISLGVIGAVLVSIWQTIISGEHAYFDSAVMLLFFLLIGRYLDFRARRKARGAATDLLAMMSGTALLLDNEGNTKSVPIRDLREGMRVMVPMGQRIPADSIVLDGVSDIDTSLVTGETIPRPVSAGSQTFAGTINLSGALTLKVTSAAKDSLLSDIVRLMEKAEQGQAKYVRFADRAARFYTPAVHTLAAGTLLGWWLLGGMAFPDAVLIAVTVLIITCPCALGLAVPVVQVLATGRLMRQHVLVKSGDALERMATIDTVLFDKTGTLTLGRPALLPYADIRPAYLRYARTLASQSHHPLSRALLEGLATSEPVIADCQVQEFPGQGLEASIDGQIVRLGSRQWCGDHSAPVTRHQEIWLSVDGAPVTAFQFEDQLRGDSRQTIDELKRFGLTPVLLSGDRTEVARDVARQLGIDQVVGDMSPIDKYNFLEDLKSKGHKVMMVGDGLNDAPTIAGADISISPSSAIDMTQNAADIVFVGDQLGAVTLAYKTSIFSQKLVKENFALAILYNVIAVPLAVMGLASPLVAAIAMSGSSLVVIGNSFRLSRMKG